MTVEELYEAIGGSYADAKRTLMMDKMIARFVVKLPDDPSYQMLKTAYMAEDWGGMFAGAHAMKGVCANLGLTDLAKQAEAITEEFRPGHSRTMSDEELAERMTALRETHKKTVEGIRAFAAEQEN